MAESKTPDTEDVHTTGYAVYDHTLLRFVTGVYLTKADAEAELTKVKGHKYETRAV